jgi:signal transduction histidine kinase
MAAAEYQQDSPLYNSRIVNTYVRLLRERYSYIDINRILAHAGIDHHQVVDEGHWFTQKQMNRFHEKMNELCGAINIAREAGIYSASAGNLGSMRRHLFSLIRPSTLYKMVGRVSEKLTRSASFEVRPVNNTTVEIIVTPYPGVKEEPYQCQNRQGFFEAIPMIYHSRMPIIKHEECIFKGDKHCRYIVNWQPSAALRWKRIRNIAIPLLASAAILSFWAETPSFPPAVVLPGSVAAMLMLGWYAETKTTQELNYALERLQQTSFEDLNRINEIYNNSLLVNEIGKTLGSATEKDEVMTKIVEVMQKRLDFDRGIILLPNLEQTHLVYKTGYGYTEEQLSDFVGETAFHLDRPESKGIFIVCFREQKSFLINDINEIKDDLSPRSQDFLKKSGVSSFICCPITYENETLGILAVDNIYSKRSLVQRDLNLLQGVAAQIGISIHSAQLKNQLLQSQKMESIGQLTSGLAHDFNNILMIVMNYSGLALEKVSDDEVIEFLQGIRKAGEKACNLTKQLLTFSRDQKIEMQGVNLNPVINDMREILDRMAGNEVELKIHIEQPISNIKADPGRLEQVLMNLAANARDAMPDGGSLTIETADELVTENSNPVNIMLGKGRYVRLTVSDTGTGMPTSVQKRVFEPFFTTKTPDKGTGLGLATVYGIIKQHNGYIHLNSEENQGTTFNIYLPAA